MHTLQYTDTHLPRRHIIRTPHDDDAASAQPRNPHAHVPSRSREPVHAPRNPSSFCKGSPYSLLGKRPESLQCQPDAFAL